MGFLRLNGVIRLNFISLLILCDSVEFIADFVDAFIWFSLVNVSDLL